MSSLLQKIALLLSLLVLAGCATPRPESGPVLQLGTELEPLEISGTMAQDLWLGGVIRLTGDLLVPAGRSLHITAGSQVRVVGNDSTKIDPEFLDKGTEILVRGRLILAGQQGSPVKLSLDESTPAGENWAGIELVAAQSVILSHVDIFSAETGILSLDSSPQLEEVNILGSRYGLLLQGGGKLIYRGGRISGGDAGLLCFDHSALDLLRLSILDNLEEGLYLARGCSLKQQDLQIARNDLGVVASEVYREALKPVLQANRIDFRSLPAGSQ